MHWSENILLICFITAIIITHILNSSIQDPINKKNGKPYIKSKEGQKDYVNFHLLYAIEMLGMAIVIFTYTIITFKF